MSIDLSYNQVIEHQSRLLHEMTMMVLRQTPYTYEEARDELAKHKGNYMLVIRNGNGVSDKAREDTAPKLSVNQETYKQIRRHMDEGSEQFRRQQECNEYVRGGERIRHNVRAGRCALWKAESLAHYLALRGAGPVALQTQGSVGRY